MAHPMTEHPAADRGTSKAFCVEQARPLVGLSTWLADAYAVATGGQRQLFLVTPATTRITFPAETLLAGSPHRWAARAPGAERFFDGLSGEPLHWDGAVFVPADGVPPQAPTSAWPSGEGRLRLDISVLHRASDSLEIGSTVEDCASALLDSAAAGWGVAEPASQPWSLRELTRFCRDRAPQPSTLVVVAGTPPRRAVGLMSVSRVTTGVVERLQLALGSDSGADGPALDALAHALAARGARSMLAAWQPGRPDGTRGAEPTPPPTPLGMLVGAERVAVHGVEHAQAGAAGTATLLGPEHRPACWIRTDAPDADPFAQFRTVLQHFTADPTS